MVIQRPSVWGSLPMSYDVEQFADHLGEVVNERSNRYVEIERELIESEEARGYNYFLE